MNSRTMIQFFGWKFAGPMVLALLVSPAWGQQPQNATSSRINYQQVVGTAPNSPSPPSVRLASAISTLTTNSPDPIVTAKAKSTRRSALQPMFGKTVEERPDSDFKSAIKKPKLADPEQFRVNSPSNTWIKLQDQDPATQSSISDQVPQSTQSTEPDQGDEDTLLGRLPESDLRSGIAYDSMQKAVFNRSESVPDPNLSFVASASPAPIYSTAYQPITKTWRSPNMINRPLYFEDANLERYGNGLEVWQPALSGLKFFSTIGMLPYKMGANPPSECEYSLGYFRPGDCNPAFKPSFEFSGRGALVQGLVVGGIWAGL